MSASSNRNPLSKALHLGSGNIIAQGIGILTMPVLTRIYSPAQYGHLGLYLSVAAILTGVSTLQYEMGILSSPDDAAAENYAGGALRLSATISCLVAIGYWLIPGFDERYFSAPKWLSGLILGALCFLSALQVVLRYLFLRSHHNKALLAAAPSQGVARASSQFILSKFTLNWGLLIGEFLSRIPPIFLLARRLEWRNFFGKKGATFALLRKQKKYPIFLLPSFLIDTLAQSLPMLYLARAFGLEAAGLFAMQQRLWQIPLQVVSDGSADVIHTVFTNAHASADSRRLRKVFARSTLALLGISLVWAGFFSWIGPSLIPWVLGDKWQRAGHLAALTTPWYAAAIIIAPLSRLIMVTGKVKTKLIYDLLTLGAVATICEAASQKGWSLEQAARTLAWTYFATYAFYFLILLRALKPTTKTEAIA